jgi:hypothetical protein
MSNEERLKKLGRKILEDTERSGLRAKETAIIAGDRTVARAKSVGSHVAGAGRRFTRAAGHRLSRARDRLRSTRTNEGDGA